MKRFTTGIVLLLVAAVVALGFGGAGCGGTGDLGDLVAVEVREYQGENLSSIADFSENSIKGPQQVEGNSYGRILKGEDVPRPTSQPYFWIPCDQPALGRRGVRTKTHTYVETREPGQPVARVLYDRVQDPFQLEGITVEDPAIVQDLMYEMTHWLEIAGDPWLLADKDRSRSGGTA